MVFHLAYLYSLNSKEGGLRPPSISPCGAGVLAPDCRGPSAPSSQSLRTSYKVGHYCVYPVTLCKSRRTLNGDIGLSVNCFVTRKSNQSRCIERRIDGLLSKMVFVVKLHLQLSQLLLYICSSYICSCNISGWSHLQFNLYAVSTNAIDHICSWGTTFAGPHLQFKYQNFRGYITLSEIRQWVTDCNTLSIHRHVQPFFSFWN